jgi:hypothetical protein
MEQGPAQLDPLADMYVYRIGSAATGARMPTSST